VKEYLTAIKDDLLDSNRLPYLIVLCVALVAVIGYVALAGGGSSSSSVSSSGSTSKTQSAATVTPTKAPAATNVDSETTNGLTGQHAGDSRNPFAPLPKSKSEMEAEEKAKSASSGTSSSSSSSSSSTSGSTGSSGSSSGSTEQTGGSTPTQPAKPAPQPKPKQPEKTYNVALLFGVFSPPPQNSQLTPYENVKRGLKLPSPQVALVMFTGTSKGGTGARFELSGEAIIKGAGTCLPSPEQCTSIELKVGQAEQLEYIPGSGSPIVYELQVVSITPSSSTSDAGASAARARSARRAR
jgi:hypothetical protein